MADGPNLGTAYLKVAPDFTEVQAQAAALFNSPRWSKMGKVAGAGLAVGFAAGGVLSEIYKVGKAFDDAYDKIRVGTGATGKQLGKLQKDFRNVIGSVPADFESASTAVADLNTRLGLTGKPLRRLSKQFTELSRITNTDVGENIQKVTRAFGDWQVKAKDQADTLDFLFRASQASGASVSELADQVVKFGAPLRQVGFDIEEAVAMFAQFEKAGVNTQTMMPGLRFALKQFLLEDIDPKKGLIRAFRDIEDGTMKASEALDLFGQRAGADMIEAINQGRFDLDEFTKSLAESDETIRGAGRETMDFAEHWQKFRNQLLLKLEPVAEKVFGGLGDLMKDLTRAMKREGIDGIVDVLVDRLGDAAEKVGKIAPDVAKAFVRGFLDANVWGKLAIGALLIRAFGGKGAFTSLGRRFGGWIAAPMMTTLAAESAAATTAGGALGGRWRGIGKSIGRFIGVGAVASLVLALSDDEIREKVKNIITGEMLDAPPREEFASKIRKVGDFIGAEIKDLWFGRGNRVIVATGFGRLIFNSETEKVVKAQGKRLRGLVGKTLGEIETNPKLQNLLKNPGLRSAFKPLADSAEKHGKQTAKAAERYAGEAWRPWRGALQRLADRADRDGGKFRTALERAFSKVAKKAEDKSSDAWEHWRDFGISLKEPQQKANRFASNISSSFESLADASVEALAYLAGETRETLNSLNVKNSVYVAQVRKGKGKADTLKAQKGAILPEKSAIVPGLGDGDKVPLHIGGRLAAMVEPGELVSVTNRKATAALMEANKKIPRFATGGLAFAYGPYDIPPIKYDAAHAGGNAHVHISGSPPSWVVGIGKKLQSMGFLVGEHPQFGGVTGRHAHYGPTDHYHGGAIDVNSPRNLVETREEVARIAAVLRGSGVPGGIADQLARVIIDGPAGPLRSGAQAAVDKVRKAANRFISESAPAEPSGEGAGNLFSKSELVALWKRVNDGLGDANLMAAIALAESGGNPAANGPPDGRGLWQIEWPIWGSTLGHLGNPYNPAANAKMAAEVFKRQGLSAWVTYNRGLHVKFLQRGGILGSILGLKDGGIPFANFRKAPGRKKGPRFPLPPGQVPTVADIDRAIGLIEQFDKGGDRRFVAQKLAKRFRQIPTPGVAGGDLTGDLKALRDAADRAGEFADMASSLERPVGGKSEEGWLREQLGQLFALRELLVSVEAQAQAQLEAVDQLVEAMRERLRKVTEQLTRARRRQKEIETTLENLKSAREITKKELQTELDKPKKKRNQAQIDWLRNSLKVLEGAIKDSQGDLRRTKENVGLREFLRGTIKDRWQPALREKREDLQDARETISDELANVQGSFGPVGHQIDFEPIRDLGKYGGELWDAQFRLHELLKESDSEDKRDPFRVSDLQRFAEAVQLGAFKTEPYMGAFKEGGVALVGEAGPELAHLPSGTRIHNAEDTARLLNPTIDAEVRVFIGDREITDIVRTEIRRRDEELENRSLAGVV